MSPSRVPGGSGCAFAMFGGRIPDQPELRRVGLAAEVAPGRSSRLPAPAGALTAARAASSRALCGYQQVAVSLVGPIRNQGPGLSRWRPKSRCWWLILLAGPDEVPPTTGLGQRARVIVLGHRGTLPTLCHPLSGVPWPSPPIGSGVPGHFAQALPSPIWGAVAITPQQGPGGSGVPCPSPQWAPHPARPPRLGHAPAPTTSQQLTTGIARRPAMVPSRARSQGRDGANAAQSAVN
jgi:hypothetical protein